MMRATTSPCLAHLSALMEGILCSSCCARAFTSCLASVDHFHQINICIVHLHGSKRKSQASIGLDKKLFARRQSRHQLFPYTHSDHTRLMGRPAQTIRMLPSDRMRISSASGWNAHACSTFSSCCRHIPVMLHVLGMPLRH